MKVYIKSSSSVDKLSGNKFWDNNDRNYPDLREAFVESLRKYWEQSPNRIKREPKRGGVSLLGLFGASAGISINYDAFPVKKSYSVKELIYDFCQQYNIPVYLVSTTNAYYVFSNKYSAVSYQESMNPYGYNTNKIDKARQEVYGKTSKRRYNVHIHIGDYSKERSNKYTSIALPISKSLNQEMIVNKLPEDISVNVYSVEIKSMLNNSSNEGEVEVKIKTSEPLSKEQQNIIESCLLDIFNVIPEEFIRINMFTFLEY